MFHPCRGGVRGGKDQFTWESVKTDKDRECYLGHSVMAPVGRWQQGKDIHWYNAEDKAKQAKVINEEFLKAKELEEKALMAALGYKVVEKPKQNSELEQMKIKQEYEEKARSKKREDNEEKVKIKKEKQGPQIVDFDSTHELDEMLLKLVAKYGFDKVFDALADEDKSSRKHKKKHKKHHKSSKKSKRTHESSDSESESGDRKRKKSKHKSSKKSSSKDNSSSQSSSSSSDSD